MGEGVSGRGGGVQRRGEGLQYLTATDSQLTDFPKSRRWEALEREKEGERCLFFMDSS